MKNVESTQSVLSVEFYSEEFNFKYQSKAWRKDKYNQHQHSVAIEMFQNSGTLSLGTSHNEKSLQLSTQSETMSTSANREESEYEIEPLNCDIDTQQVNPALQQVD